MITDSKIKMLSQYGFPIVESDISVPEIKHLKVPCLLYVLGKVKTDRDYVSSVLMFEACSIMNFAKIPVYLSAINMEDIVEDSCHVYYIAGVHNTHSYNKHKIIALVEREINNKNFVIISASTMDALIASLGKSFVEDYSDISYFYEIPEKEMRIRKL